MKSTNKLMCPLKIMLLLACCASNSALGTEYFLIPGLVKSGPREGREITLAMNGRLNPGQAVYEGTGIVLGTWLDSKKEVSLEIQYHVQGYFVFGYSAGVGAYRSRESHGLQGTLSFQYWTPFIIFMREQIQTYPVVVAKRPEFGLMFKIPIPAEIVPKWSRRLFPRLR